MKEEVALEKEKLTPKDEEIFDLLIVGAGPAGLSAALCAGRARLKVLIVDKALPGGQAATAYKIYNYLGFPKGILGSDLSSQMEEHLKDYDIHWTTETVEDIINVHSNEKTVLTDIGHRYKVKSIILATGLEPKELGASFEKQFIGRGISYFAQCDAESYRGKDVAVIGGGNCACYAVEYLSEYVNKLYLIHQSDYIKAVASLKEKIMNNPKVDILWDTELTDVFGIDKVEKIKLRNMLTTQETWLDVKGVFIYVGRKPPQDIISVDVAVDENGYVLTDEYMRTNIPYVYAAGDIRAKQIRQIPTAISDGMIAAINAQRDIGR